MDAEMVAAITELQEEIERLKVAEQGSENFWQLPPATELTIAAGVITVTQSYHTVDTESDAASDDLDTISGGSAGDIVVLRAEKGSRTIVIKDSTDNLRLAGDFSLTAISDTIILLNRDGSIWAELSRSDNAT